MSTISDLASNTVATSRNLRGLLEYARKHPVARVITRRDLHGLTGAPSRGALTVIYANGAIGRESFASFHIMIDWTRERRSWQGAQFLHIDGNLGYLTRPGLIAGE